MEDTMTKKKAAPEINENLRIVFMPLSKLRPAARNPKDHDIGAVILSYREFGFITPGVINETTGTLVVGHGRAEALLEMKRDGEDPPRRIQVKGKGKDKEWMIPFLRGIAFKDDEEAEAFVIADNKLSELGGWNWGLLPEVLSDLKKRNLLKVTGFDEDDLDKMLKDLEAPPEFPSPNHDTSSTCPKCGYEWRE